MTPPSRAEVVGQIEAELARAAEQWSAAGDDPFSRLTWLKLLDEHRIRATRYGTIGDDYRYELVVIAALAIAAIEAHDARPVVVDATEARSRSAVSTTTGALADAAEARSRSTVSTTTGALAAAAERSRASAAAVPRNPAIDDPSCKHRSHFECVTCRRMFCTRCEVELAEASNVWKTLHYQCRDCLRKEKP
jgi:hypothetical protein